MAKSSTTPMRSRLERARSAQNGIRLVRSIPGADVIKAYVLDVGSKWVLMAAVDRRRGMVPLVPPYGRRPYDSTDWAPIEPTRPICSILG